ncbi:MAG: heme/hemin ABC transporter substrate-binding protein [Pseudomonadota bacterium]
MSCGVDARGLVLAGALLVAATPALASERLVSLGGDVTEIVFALGAGDRLVAVDGTSQYPATAEDLPDVGYLRRLAAEPIVALAPDLVLASAAAGPPVVLDQLAKAGIPVVTVPDEPDVAGVVAKIEAVGAALDLPSEAKRLANDVERRVAAVDEALGGVPDRPRVLFMLDIGRGAPLTGGRDTSAAAIIALAGGANAVDGFAGYKPLSQEAAIVAAPDVVLLPEATLQALGGPEALFERPELRSSPAAAAGRVVAMDGLLLLGFGPRLGEAVLTLARALHPDLPVEAR